MTDQVKPQRVRFILAFGIMVVAVISVIVWQNSSLEEDKGTLVLYGNVDIRELALGFRVSGRLQEMVVDEGDAITAGQVIARIDPLPYQQAQAVAEARVAAALANLDRLNAGSRPAEIQQAMAAVRETAAAQQNTERNLERQRSLLDSGASSQRIVDEALAANDAAAARLSSATEALALAKEGFRPEEIAAGEAQLAAAIAERDISATALADTLLASPSPATVLSRALEPGSMLAQGEAVYSLSLRDPVYVRAYVSEPDLGKLEPGTIAYVTTDSNDTRYRGTVGFISPRAEFTPKSVETTDLRTDLVYRLRISVEQSDDGLRQGMPVTVELPFDVQGD